jgi:molybdopterin converting factor small subunit
MATLKIPTPLRSYTNGESIINVSGHNVAEAMEDLIKKYPTLKPHLYNGDENLRPFVNLFVGENNITDLQGLETPLDENTRVILIPSIAGGSGFSQIGGEQESNRQAREVRKEKTIKLGMLGALRGSILTRSQCRADFAKALVGG